ncbi:hypothetical protein MHYP_G00107630 [Metynnis hypsauchen]
MEQTAGKRQRECWENSIIELALHKGQVEERLYKGSAELEWVLSSQQGAETHSYFGLIQGRSGGVQIGNIHFNARFKFKKLQPRTFNLGNSRRSLL